MTCSVQFITLSSLILHTQSLVRIIRALPPLTGDDTYELLHALNISKRNNAEEMGSEGGSDSSVPDLQQLDEQEKYIVDHMRVMWSIHRILLTEYHKNMLLELRDAARSETATETANTADV